jgi:parvulin-like peptidyl-prolyl isomerase
LLGPNPDIMPPIPDISQLKPMKTKPSTAPPAGQANQTPVAIPAPAPESAPSSDGPPLEAAPSAEAPPAIAPAGATAAPKVDSGSAPAPGAGAAPASPGNTSAAGKPAGDQIALVPVPLEAAPGPAAVNVIPASTRATAPGPSTPRADPQVARTALEQPGRERQQRQVTGGGAGGPVARVGDEIITFHEFKQALRENLKRFPQLQEQLRTFPDQREANRVREQFARETLDGLIDRSLLAQEARRHIKDAKMIEQFHRDADRIFHDDTIVPLQRQYNLDSEYKLRERLTEEGRSLDAMRVSFRQLFLAESYMQNRIRDRLKVDLPEMLKYYNEHKNSHDFDLPAQITWREVVVEVGNHKNRDEARRKAGQLLDRLRKGEDFARLAKSESEGPTGARNQGGLMLTSPGSYAVLGVNQALESMPIGQVSDVLEGPDSLHIVKVERRRAAGPASFEEVQDKIKPILQNERMHAERTAFIAKLRKKTLIQIYI